MRQLNHYQKPPVYGRKSGPNEPLVSKHACRLVYGNSAFHSYELEDVQQELSFRAECARRKCDPLKGSEGAYVNRALRNQSRSMNRERRALKHDSRQRGPSLDWSSDEDASNLADNLDDRRSSRHRGNDCRSDLELADLRHDVRLIVKGLPQNLRIVANLLMTGSASAISRELGISQRQVTNRIREILRRFEDAGLKEYL